MTRFDTKEDSETRFQKLHIEYANAPASAQALLGRAILAGKMFAGCCNRAEGIVWLQRALDNGYPHAEHYLGQAFLLGEAVPRDLEAATHYYQQAAAKGDRGAGKVLDFIRRWPLLQSANPQTAEKLLQETVSDHLPGAKPDDETQRAAWRSAAESGDVEAQFQLFMSLVEEHQLIRLMPEAEYAKAQHWLRQAAEGGHLEAQLWLGELYYREALAHSRGGSIRLEQQAMAQAMAWFHRAAEAGSSKAHAWIGHLLLWGIGQEADPVAAIDWLTRAIATASPPDKDTKTACFELGLCAAEGRGMARDGVRAAQFLEQAATGFFAHGEAAFNLGLLHTYGLDPLPPDPAQAFHWYFQAARSWLWDSVNSLGICYLLGFGVEASVVEARYCFQKAAEHDLPDARQNLQQLDRSRLALVDSDRDQGLGDWSAWAHRTTPLIDSLRERGHWLV